MAEPHASTAIGAAAGAGLAAPWWLFGADPAATVLGLTAATLVSFWLPEISSRPRAACAVGLAGLLAGFGAPTAQAALSALYPAMTPQPGTAPLIGLIIGVIAPKLVPIALKAAAGWMGKASS